MLTSVSSQELISAEKKLVTIVEYRRNQIESAERYYKVSKTVLNQHSEN